MNRHNATHQIATHQRREATIKSMASKDPSKSKGCARPSKDEALAFASPNKHYHIADSQRKYYDILQWVYENRSNPGVKVSLL